MKMMSKFARDLIAKGRKEGLLEGYQKGYQEGYQEGYQKGLHEGVVRNLLLLMKHRFGPVPDWVTAKLDEADLEVMERWTERILDAESLQAVFQ